MALDTDAGLELVVSEAEFAGIVAKLQGQITTLQDYKAQYMTMKNKIDDCFSTDTGESEKYKESIQNQIDNINVALETTQDVFAEYGKLSQSLESAVTTAGTLAGDVAEVAKTLFA